MIDTCTIHWVGGELPQVGKSWCTRALVETIRLWEGIMPMAIDTSPTPTMSQIYNPQLLKVHSPQSYFTPAGIQECLPDEILALAMTHRIAVVKLATQSQRLFLQWIRESSIFNTPIEQHFWFVSDGRKGSRQYFLPICTYPWRLHYVQNLHTGGTPIVAHCSEFDIHHLPSILSQPSEISAIERQERPLLDLQRDPNFNSLSRIRLDRFLKQSRQNLWEINPSIVPPAPPVTKVSAIPMEEEEEEIPF
jgi:hypothetical protein